MSITMKAAKLMVGNGWFDSQAIQKLGFTRKDAQRIISRIEKSGTYDTEFKRDGRNQVKVIGINGQIKLDKTARLWRLCIYQERLT